MMPASHNMSGGTINCPDPCLATWVNFTNHPEAATFSPNIFYLAGNALFMASVMPISHGDEPDTPVFVPTIGPAFFPMGIPNILVNGIPAIALMSPCISNACNASSGAVMIPSAVNTFLMYRSDEARDDVRELASALAASPVTACDLLEDGVGVVRIGTFTSATPATLHGAIAALTKRGMRSLLIDLRGSPGGEVMGAIECAGDFLAPGALVCTLRDEDGDDVDHRARAGAHFTMPVTIFVDEETASAAELFAGALQAHGRAVIAGKSTCGKGSIQTIASHAESGALERTSVATCVLPNGASIEGRGLVPDVGL